jgi:WD40 repeat protein
VDVLGGSVVAGSSDKIVRVWDLASGRSTHAMAGHTGQVISVRGVGDGRLILSAAADRTIRLWDVRAHRPVRTMATSSVPRCADVTGDGSFAVVGHLNKSLRVFDLGRAAPVAELSGAHSKLVMSVSYSRGDSSSRVLSYGQEGTWRILSAATLAPISAAASAAGSDAVSLKGFRPWSKRGQASLSPLSRGGGYVAATSDDGRIGIWKAGDCSHVRSLQGGHPCSATAVAWAPDGRRLVSVDAEGGLSLWQ